MNEKEFKVTPYEVKGTVDYNKLIEQFGIKRLDSKILNKIKEITKKDSHYLRREIYFAHRDLKWALDEYEKGNNS